MNWAVPGKGKSFMPAVCSCRLVPGSVAGFPNQGPAKELQLLDFFSGKEQHFTGSLRIGSTKQERACWCRDSRLGQPNHPIPAMDNPSRGAAKTLWSGHKQPG